MDLSEREKARIEQRAFSVKEVARMLGVGRTTVYELLDDELGSAKIGGSRRIFLSDLEDYLGEERAHSLVKQINNDPDQAGE
jgi:excisionase family DNA binding protein